MRARTTFRSARCPTGVGTVFPIPKISRWPLSATGITTATAAWSAMRTKSKPAPIAPPAPTSAKTPTNSISVKSASSSPKPMARLPSPPTSPTSSKRWTCGMVSSSAISSSMASRWMCKPSAPRPLSRIYFPNPTGPRQPGRPTFYRCEWNRPWWPRDISLFNCGFPMAQKEKMDRTGPSPTPTPPN